MKKSSNTSKEPFLQIPENCPSCGKKYSQTKINILSNQENSVLIHITCSNCLTSVISSIALEGPRVTAVGMLTDLDKSDLKLFNQRETITVDHVIEMHEIIEKQGVINF
ncbi:MAG: hypothetical protein GF332_04245 [Candidatus Moranbacteria bacterium]|nr:hypothetical protein [Candidatus Moranbacteria bacterium]